MCKNNKAFMFSMGVIAGVVGGIVAGVLFAPKSGEESRKELKDTVCDFYDKHAPQIVDAKNRHWSQLTWLNTNWKDSSEKSIIL